MLDRRKRENAAYMQKDILVSSLQNKGERNDLHAMKAVGFPED